MEKTKKNILLIALLSIVAMLCCGMALLLSPTSVANPTSTIVNAVTIPDNVLSTGSGGLGDMANQSNGHWYYYSATKTLLLDGGFEGSGNVTNAYTVNVTDSTLWPSYASNIEVVEVRNGYFTNLSVFGANNTGSPFQYTLRVGKNTTLSFSEDFLSAESGYSFDGLEFAWDAENVNLGYTSYEITEYEEASLFDTDSMTIYIPDGLYNSLGSFLDDIDWGPYDVWQCDLDLYVSYANYSSWYSAADEYNGYITVNPVFYGDNGLVYNVYDYFAEDPAELEGSDPAYADVVKMLDYYASSVTIPTNISLTVDYDMLTSVNPAVDIPVKTIGADVFAGHGLYQATLSAGIETIDNNAFKQCPNLLSVTIPSSVTSIGNYAFYGCTNLTSIEFQETTPPTLGSSALPIGNTGFTIYVPDNNKQAYSSGTGWTEAVLEKVHEEDLPETGVVLDIILPSAIILLTLIATVHVWKKKEY